MKIIDLHYQLGDDWLFCGLNAHFHHGIIGISGENGCGKSTLLRVLSGICKPTKGSIEIKERDLYSHLCSSKKIIHYVSNRTFLYPHLTVEENLYFVAMNYQLSKNEFKTNLKKVLAEFQLENYKQVLFGKCSDGLKKRIMLATAAIHDAPILILDEPCASLSSINRQWLWALLQSYAANGKQIILSSHHLDEIANFCSQRYVLDQGQLHLQSSAPSFSEIVLTQNADDGIPEDLEVASR